MLKKQLSKLISSHEDYIKREQIVLNLLKFYSDNKRYNEFTGKLDSHFWDIFGNDLLTYIKDFDQKDIESDAEYLYEFLDEVVYFIQYGIDKGKYVQLQSNGIFSTFVVTNKKKLATTLDDVLPWSDFSGFEGW